MKIKVLLILGLQLIAFNIFGQPAFTINGVSDRSIGTAFTITIPVESGYSYYVLLDGEPVASFTNFVVNKPDYHILSAYRTNLSSGVVTNRVIRFIVRSPERGNTEDGIPPWTPYPRIPSSSEEFNGGFLKVIAPSSFPAGYDIPVVVWVVNSNGLALRVNGEVKAERQNPIKIFRGVGSGFITASNGVAQLNYIPSIGGISTSKVINIENNVNWTVVSGVINGNVNWGENSRIYISTNLTISAGATLTIGAGTVVRVNYRTDITNNGAIVINGTVENPVIFIPNSPAQPWGGFIMRAGTGEITGTGVIFTGSGAIPNWFGTGGNPGSHRPEQALFFIGNNQRITLTDSAAIYLAGQLGHSVGGGILILNRFLMQRCTTGGEYTGASFNVNDSAFIECPDDTPNFVDGDNDALYIVSGTHGFTNTLFGWTKDDGVDSGGSGSGVLNYSNCWFESTFHEGNSLSGTGKMVYHYNTVFIGCGQGLEAGYDGPNGFMVGCLAVNNLVGGRFGDNYNWTYNGFLTASNSVLIYNYRDVWGMNWSDWTYRTNQMNIQNNWLTGSNAYHPTNFIWNPDLDRWRLAKFGAAGRPGIGVAVREVVLSWDSFTNGIPVGLSIFSTNDVKIDYVFESSSGQKESAVLVFKPGEVLKKVIPSQQIINSGEIFSFRLVNPVNCEITGIDAVYSSVSKSAVLIPQMSFWKYLDDGSDQGVAWRELNFDDSRWKSGRAELGFGDGNEVTVINKTNASGTQIITYYFRKVFIVDDPSIYDSVIVNLRRDDGGVVYINGVEVFRSNMTNAPGVPIRYNDFAGDQTGSETAFYSTNFSATLLRAGTNLAAVEIHQNSLTSSDISFELELIAIPKLRVRAAKLGSNIVINWDDRAATLEYAHNITGPWYQYSNTNRILIEPPVDRKFFRLRKP